MCGKSVPKTQRVMVDNAVLNLCDSCSKFGKPLDKKPEPITMKYNAPAPRTYNTTPRATAPHKVKSKPPRRERSDLDSLEVSPEYPDIVKEAREKLEWTQEELALKILEKKNVVAKIERGELMPSVKLARKLEKLLDVKLIESI